MPAPSSPSDGKLGQRPSCAARDGQRGELLPLRRVDHRERGVDQVAVRGRPQAATRNRCQAQAAIRQDSSPLPRGSTMHQHQLQA
eukprot:489380-Heterocapsa_arctica.AAC.1